MTIKLPSASVEEYNHAIEEVKGLPYVSDHSLIPLMTSLGWTHKKAYSFLAAWPHRKVWHFGKRVGKEYLILGIEATRSGILKGFSKRDED